MSKPLLHLVFGGRVADPRGTDFVDTDGLHVIGIYPNYATALKAWRGASQSRVDEADWKYVILHIHRMLEPSQIRRMFEPDQRDMKESSQGKRRRKSKSRKSRI